MQKIILMLATLLMPLAANALTMADLTPGQDDATMRIFAYIFGNIGGIFPGAADSTVIGDMFHIFNSAMMIVGGVLIGYILLTGTLKTAHEGEVLGRQWSSIFIPLRSSLAIGMILPGPSGFCLAQIFVLYCAIGGVGMANKVWSIAEQKLLFGTSEVSFASDGSKIIDALLSGYTCQRALNFTNTGDAVAAQSLSVNPVITSTDKARVYDWGNCGRVEIPFTPSKDSAVDAIYLGKISLLESSVLKSLVALSEKIERGLNTPQDSIAYAGIKKSFNDSVSNLAQTTYKMIVGGQGQDTANSATYALGQKYGWILSGASYMKMSRSYQELSGKASSNILEVTPNYDLLGASKEDIQNTMLAYSNFIEKSSKDAKKIVSVAGTASKTEAEYASNVESDIKAALGEGKLPSLNSLISPLSASIQRGIIGDPTSTIFSGAFDTVISNDSLGNPMLELVSFGTRMSNAAMVAYGAGAVVSSGIIGAADGSIGRALPFSFGSALKQFFAMIGPFLGIITIAIISAGLSMSIYLPMMPMIIWIMAVVGYIVLVFESLLAAPIWAVMHASPEGHEWSGKGAQGYMIIMGVMLRPTLMIFGLVGAIILINVFLTLMKVMFAYAAGLLDIESGIGPISYVVLFCIFVWLAIKIMHRSLDIINEVPSELMKWIGGGHDPLDGHVAQQGTGFVGGVLSKGESAAQASGMARKGLLDKNKATNETAGTDAKAGQDAAIDKQKMNQLQPNDNQQSSSKEGEKF